MESRRIGSALHRPGNTEQNRPIMTEVVEGLREVSELEASLRSMRCGSIGTNGSAIAEIESLGALQLEEIAETLLYPGVTAAELHASYC